MNEVIHAAADLQEFFEVRGWQFCVIGGLALQRWGEPRETVDVDVTLLTGFGDENTFVAELLHEYEPRIADAENFAMQHRVLLLRAVSGVGLDIALGALPYEQLCINRATAFKYPGGAIILTCSAEDLIVMKAFAGRARDWVDIDGILVRQNQKLDWNYIREQLEPLVDLKGTRETLAELEQHRRAMVDKA